MDLVERSVRRLAPGAAHVPDALTLAQQRRLAASCRDWPGEEIATRGTTSRRQVGSVPDWLVDLGREVLARAMRSAGLDHSEPTAPGADDPGPVAPPPDLWQPSHALVTSFGPGDTLRMHQVPGGPGPVVVLSIGDDGRFRLGNTRTGTRPYRDVLLESGDALVHGGPARPSFIGVPSTRPGTAPEWCGLTEGHLEIALVPG